jgi:hypothetical protein
MAITLEEIAKAIKEYDPQTATDLPTFGSATVAITPEGIKAIKAEIVWGGYIQIDHPDFIYTINFGEADNGWSYNDDEGYGFGDFIGTEHFTSAKEIADVFFGQVKTNENLSKSVKGLQDTWSTFQKELQNTNNASCDCGDC